MLETMKCRCVREVVLLWWPSRRGVVVVVLGS